MKINLKKIYGVYLGIFVLWFIYRYTTRFSDITDELIAKPLIWLTPILFVMPVQKLLALMSFERLNAKNIFIGIIGGIFLTVLQVIPLMMQGLGKFHIPAGLLALTIATVGTAMAEELVFRGFLFKQLQQRYSPIITYTITSLLFSAIHIPILLVISHYSGVSLLSSLYILFTSSIVFCWLYAYSKNLWVAILAHYMMDFLLLIF